MSEEEGTEYELLGTAVELRGELERESKKWIEYHNRELKRWENGEIEYKALKTKKEWKEEMKKLKEEDS